ncbi:GMC family oxidoreductase N-terminal domain-containing protein [Microbacterium awajiense]|uniref:GMC family oxidoreductase N-terminal domain-containing protein n=1 Tax=Microbacterium awajiense TaxID=415214 RepID=A0ABP7AL63_9MICO
MTRTIVVGGGAAGSALTARLSDDPDREVTLIEAGRADGVYPPELLDASGIRGAMPGHPATWTYEALLARGRPYAVARGRILGGSTTINGGYFVRARRGDHDIWADAGGPRWSYDACLPIWRAIEADADFGATALHGAAGPVPVRRHDGGLLAAAFTEAATARGHPLEPDKNGEQPAGVGPVPSNVRGGVRVNTGLAYIEPVRGRTNLRILGSTTVARIRWRGARAVGVETDVGGVDADEVVLCAGAIGSARILLSSGVGPQRPLSTLGIAVRADLPVGTAFADHPDIAVAWRPRGVIPDSADPFPFPVALHLDAAGRGGADGDLELLLAARPLDQLLTGSAAPDADRQVIVGLQAPRGRGELSLRSADPTTSPRVAYRYLEEASDRDRLRSGIRETAALLQTGALGEVCAGLSDLGDAQLQSDGALDDWMHAHLGTAIHMCATAPIGDVVDGAGRVLGVEGLRVADTSILPSVPSRGPAASAVLVGEVVARAMRAGD